MKTENMPRVTTDFDDERIKAHDLRICTWNVRSLNKLGAISQLETVFEAYKTDIIAVQEMRWTGQGRTNISSCDVYYSGHVSRHEFGCGFAVSGDLRNLVSRFTAVDERLAAIRIKAKYFYIRMTQPRMPFTTNSKFCITDAPDPI